VRKPWKERTGIEKALCLLKIMVSLVILGASCMKFLNIWPAALNLAIPLFAIYYLLETVYYWKNDKDMAALSFFMTVIIAAVSCAVFFL